MTKIRLRRGVGYLVKVSARGMHPFVEGAFSTRREAESVAKKRRTKGFRASIVSV